jgi:hypothetical protein
MRGCEAVTLKLRLLWPGRERATTCLDFDALDSVAGNV